MLAVAHTLQCTCDTDIIMRCEACSCASSLVIALQALAKTARPPRPGYCMAGTTVRIKVNHFEVKCNLTQAFHYDVVMTRPRKGDLF